MGSSMKQTAYKHSWCERCERVTFHWLDDRRMFTENECESCGLRSGVDLKIWIKRFAVPVALVVTVAMGFEPARTLLQL